MVGRTVKSPKDWAKKLLTCKFFSKCDDHKELSKNMFCIDCEYSVCKHCLLSTSKHSFHQGLQILKYVYQDVLRLQDIQKHLDSSKIQTYKINGEKAIHLNPRPQTKDAKSLSRAKDGLCCEACGRYIQDSINRFCSIACKFREVVEESEEANTTDTSTPTNDEIGSPFLRKDEAETCVFTYESPNLFAEEGFLSDSSPMPNTSLKKKRRKAIPQRAPLL